MLTISRAVTLPVEVISVVEIEEVGSINANCAANDIGKAR